MKKERVNNKMNSKPSTPYLFILGAVALIAVRFFEKNINDWESMDYYIGAVCAATIIFSILILVKKSGQQPDVANY